MNPDLKNNALKLEIHIENCVISMDYTATILWKITERIAKYCSFVSSSLIEFTGLTIACYFNAIYILFIILIIKQETINIINALLPNGAVG